MAQCAGCGEVVNLSHPYQVILSMVTHNSDACYSLALAKEYPKIFGPAPKRGFDHVMATLDQVISVEVTNGD